MNSFLPRDELATLGLGSFGDNVLVSSKASIYGAENIRLGNNVRIDDFCVISAGSGGVEIESMVHIAAYTSLIGRGRICIGAFSNLSSRVSVYSSSDDYSGEWMTNPMVPAEFTGVTDADVRLGRHVIVGSGSVILPGVMLEDGVAIGALSLVKDDCEAFGIYAGIPARRIAERGRRLLEIERQLVSEQQI
jgi:galactoside O-acetyltransferase